MGLALSVLKVIDLAERKQAREAADALKAQEQETSAALKAQAQEDQTRTETMRLVLDARRAEQEAEQAEEDRVSRNGESECARGLPLNPNLFALRSAWITRPGRAPT